MKSKLLINNEIALIGKGKFRFRSQKPVIYPANKCFKNASNCWHFNICDPSSQKGPSGKYRHYVRNDV